MDDRGKETPELAQSDFRYQIYYVKKGDTVSAIARRMRVPAEQIVRANGERATALRAGEMLFIPLHSRTDDRAPRHEVARPGGGPASSIPIVIDPGHGGKDPGAISPIGLQEKDVNLAVSKEVVRLLKQKGFRVSMTRSTDVFIELNERAAIANRREAGLFVSIHADSCRNPGARGYTLYVAREASAESRRAAKAVEEALGAGEIKSRGVRKANYRVLVRTNGPAILVELGFLSNTTEAKMLARPSVQSALAERVARGIESYLAGRERDFPWKRNVESRTH
jgi:N-acetylmuramoyl-L-alanine amidase